MANPRDGVTDLLARAGAGDRAALDAVLPLVYGELRRLAERQMRRADPGHTLSPTGLVHEAFLRLVRDGGAAWDDRAHFFALAAGAMRHILVDHARRHAAGKRGGAAIRVPLDDVDGLPAEGRAALVVALDESLARLAALDARQARVVECRFFGGFTEEETAEALGVGLRTVKRDWAKARAWLFQDLYPDAVA
jgi:RNA polymerase sigma factor (TIGR02999 family)